MKNNALKTELKSVTQTNDDLQQKLKRDFLLFTGLNQHTQRQLVAVLMVHLVSHLPRQKTLLSNFY